MILILTHLLNTFINIILHKRLVKTYLFVETAFTHPYAGISNVFRGFCQNT